jgi:hypothetical protein
MIKATSTGKFIITSPALKDGDPLPKEFNGYGKERPNLLSGKALQLKLKATPL